MKTQIKTPAFPVITRHLRQSGGWWLASVFFMILLALRAMAGGPPAPEFTDSVLDIKTLDKEISIAIQLATTPEQQSYGLMFREEVPENYGMLFDFRMHKDVITMWMKNTLVPLDILFIDKRGKIVHIVENTVPLSLDIISSEVPVSAALEMKAGEVKRLGVVPGDKVLHAWFKEK